GVPCYVATPTVHYPKYKIVLFLTDAHGMYICIWSLLAEDYTRNGFKTIVPDLFNGDPIPVVSLSPGVRSSFRLAFMAAEAQTRPLIDAVMATLKAEGVTDVACCGCTRYTFDLAFERLIKGAAIAHPSLLKRPEDIEVQTVLLGLTAPLLNGCTHDPGFPPADQEKADEILKDFAPGYKRVYWDGASHRFALKGDLSDPEVWKAKSGAFKETVECLTSIWSVLP
ncbi:chlorocatechol-degradation protein, partial [Mycena sanguinolenta]